MEAAQFAALDDGVALPSNDHNGIEEWDFSYNNIKEENIDDALGESCYSKLEDAAADFVRSYWGNNDEDNDGCGDQLLNALGLCDDSSNEESSPPLCDDVNTAIVQPQDPGLSPQKGIPDSAEGLIGHSDRFGLMKRQARIATLENTLSCDSEPWNDQSEAINLISKLQSNISSIPDGESWSDSPDSVVL